MSDTNSTNPDENGLESAEKNRHTSYKKTSDLGTIIRVVNEKLLKKDLVVQLPSSQPKTGKIISFSDKGMIIQFNNFLPPIGNVLLSGFVNDFYTELGVEVINNVKSNQFLCAPKLLRIASQKRMDERFTIDDPDLVYVNKIRISKTDLNFNGKNLPVSYKILLDQFQQENSNIGDKVFISSFMDIKLDIYNKVFKTGKTLFIADIDTFEQTNNTDESDINNEYITIQEIGSIMEDLRKVLTENGKKSWLISPILANNSEDSWVPLGFIEVQNNQEMTLDFLMSIKALSFKIVDKIKSMNLMEVKDRQRVIDVSRGGLRIEIAHPQLIDAILHRKEMIFDIVVSKQAPITVQGWIRTTKVLDNGKMQVGIKIQGENNRQNQMKRYLSFINQLSVHFKNAADSQKS